MNERDQAIRAKLAEISQARRDGDASAYADGMVEIWGLEGALTYIDIWAKNGHPSLPGDREGFFTDVESLLRLYSTSDEGVE